MSFASTKSKYEELSFLAQNPSDKNHQAILLLHSINLQQPLTCTGCLEDDVVEEYQLPPNWNKDTEGVYSLRYQNKDKDKPETFFFKFICEGDVLDVNVVSSLNPGLIHSTTLKLDDIVPLNESNHEKVHKQYKSDILSKIVHEEKPKEVSKSRLTNQEPENRNWGPIGMNREEPRGPGGFGDYGRSDLQPVPLGGGFGGIGPGSGSLMGPGNPIFMGGPSNRGPNMGGIPGARIYPTGPGGPSDPNYPDDDHLQLPGIPTKKPLGGMRDPFGGPGFRDPFGGGFGGGNNFGGPGGFGGGFGGGF